MSDAEHILDVAKSAIALKSPFFYSILLGAKIKITNEVPTAASDAKRTVYVNPDYLVQNKHSAAFILLHEVLHLVFMHSHRAEEFKVQPHLYNIAADGLINDMLINEGFAALPGSVTLDRIAEIVKKEINELREMTAEEIYRLLLQHARVIRISGCGLQTHGEEEEGEGRAGEEDDRSMTPEDVKEYWQKKVNEAVQFAKSIGKLPAHLERRFEILKPKVDWRALLRVTLNNGFSTDVISNYVRPSRRYPYLPGIKRLGYPNIWFAVDTSGSMGDAEISSAATEIYAIAKRFNAVINVIFWDATVENVQKFISAQQIISQMKPKGGGGTVIKDTLEYINDNMKIGDAVIVFTDGYIADIDDKEIGYLMNKIAAVSSSSIFLTVGAEPKDPQGWHVIKL